MIHLDCLNDTFRVQKQYVYESHILDSQILIKEFGEGVDRMFREMAGL